MKRGLGSLEAQFFAYVQMRRLQVVSTAQIAKALRLTPTQERKLLSRLSRARLIARVRRGLYLVPPRLPLGGVWTPDEALALTTLVGDRGGRFQICGPNAFNRYGFSEQIPARVYAYNNRLSGQRTVGSVTLMLIKVCTDRLGETETVRNAEGVETLYSSRARTLVDAVYDWARFNSLPKAFDWIRRDLKTGRTKPADIVRIARRYGDVGTIRRIGVLLEREGVSPALLRTLERALPGSRSLIPWIPTRPRRGRIARRWGVIQNNRD